MEIFEPGSDPIHTPPAKNTHPSEQKKHIADAPKPLLTYLLGAIFGGLVGFIAVVCGDLISNTELLPEDRWIYTKSFGCIFYCLLGSILGTMAVGFLKAINLFFRKRSADSEEVNGSKLEGHERFLYHFGRSYLGWFIALFLFWIVLNSPRGPGGLIDYLYKGAGFPWTFAHWNYEELSWFNPIAFFGDLFLGISITSVIACICAWSRAHRKSIRMA